MRECLTDPDVQGVLAIGRNPTGQHHEKLRDLIHANFADFSTIEGDLAGYDACFFCLGVSSARINQQDYTRVTYDFTMAAAEILAKQNPGMTFIYVSARAPTARSMGEPCGRG